MPDIPCARIRRGCRDIDYIRTSGWPSGRDLPVRPIEFLERLAEAKFDKAHQEELARLLLKFVLDPDETIRRPALVVLPAAPVLANDQVRIGYLALEAHDQAPVSLLDPIISDEGVQGVTLPLAPMDT